MTVEASAPSNIALIKYMGKLDGLVNRPTNSSLSYTLEHLRTFVEISPAEADSWAPLEREGLEPIALSEKGRLRFMDHFRELKDRLGIRGEFQVRSASNFPSDCGLASSASSFAALTRAAARLAEAQGAEPVDPFELADYSRKGSGSSCRSFFGPWVLWGDTGVRPLEFPLKPLLHAVVIVEGAKKEVPSSEAHRRVVTSPRFEGRPSRAEARLAHLIACLRDGDWDRSVDLVWDEFEDMHALFETSIPSFSYFASGTREVLAELRESRAVRGESPLVTMDAGANVHLLFKDDQRELAGEILSRWKGRFRVHVEPGLVRA